MVHALGFSQSEFNPATPGRLCRGRERWIEPWDLDPEETAVLHRLVVSGAAFEDDSARDALRGVQHSGLGVPELLEALFPGRTLLAFMEDGHPADLPDDTLGVEAYDGYRAGGLVQEGLVRWHKVVRGPEAVRDLLGPDPEADRVRGFAVLTGEEDLEVLAEHLFPLVGMATLDSPPARFQPAGLEELLEHVPAVALLHRDKHGPALAVYSTEPLDLTAALERVSAEHGALLVPFAIPPMLARWDRALTELRAEWTSTRSEPFPVPESGESSSWEPRWKRRKRNKADAEARSPGEDSDLDDALLVED